MRHTVCVLLLVGSSFALMGGCAGIGESDKARTQPGLSGTGTQPGETISDGGVDPALQGTVGEYATLAGGAPLVVRGYGLVVGLGANGSREVPPGIRRRLAEQMLKYKAYPSVSEGPSVSPDRIMDDLDTAVVVVTGVIPPGVPRGTHIDVTVEALPQTQTTDLDGGALLTTELSRIAVREGRTLESQPVALARGAVFVNPFGDPGAADSAKRRTGRVIGGGMTEESRSLRLVLKRPDHAMADVIQRAINARFGNAPKVANAVNPSFIDLTVPVEHRRDFKRFLDLVMHLYVRQGVGVEERKTRELTKDILLPDARHSEIALVWEAMGRTVLPAIRDLYTHENTAAAFFSARAGARLGDAVAINAIIQAAQNGASPHRFEAIAELGRIDRPEAGAALRGLLDSPDDLIRVAAYEAISDSIFEGSLTRHDVDRQFVLDMVPTKGEFIIYATQTQVPKLVLFGQTMRVRQPVYFQAPGELLTVNAGRGDDKLSVFRRVGGRLSDEFKVPFDVEQLALTVGRLPTTGESGEIRGLGLTYSQVVGVMYRLCKEQAIPARFVLQRPPEATRIYGSGGSVGRPDTDEEQP